jgi:virginiamycin B lyase
MIIPNSASGSMGMSTITLPQPDRFSPFGIAIVDLKDNSSEMQKKMLFVSDHSSSRVVVSPTNASSIPSNMLQYYTSYWTSPSKKYPATLPSQIVVDKSMKYIYFPQHGGNRISKIDTESGTMTEYDIPTGPLSTAVFIAESNDGKRVWFTEWASNKVAYLDTSIEVPINFELKNKNDSTPIVLKPNQPKTLSVQLNATEKSNYSSSALTSSPAVSLTEVELSVTGMTDSGLKAITYEAQPQRIDMEKNSTAESRINLNLIQQQGNKNNIPPRLNQYTTMVKASVLEKDQLFVSLLSPVIVKLDLPATATGQSENDKQSPEQEDQGWLEGFIGDLSFRNIVRLTAASAAVGLIGYIIYTRIKRLKSEKK